MTKTRLTTLVSLLLLPLSLLLSACGQMSPPGAHSHQSNDLSIYVLTTSYLTRAPGITKLDAKTHKPLWHTQPALSDVAFLIANEHLVVTGDHIYLSFFVSFKTKPAKHFVYAFSTRDGKELWHTEFEAYKQKPKYSGSVDTFGWLTTPTANNETVYVASSVGKVYALDARNGSLRWTYDSKLEGIFCPTKDGNGPQICDSWYNDYAAIRQLTIAHNIIYGGIKNRFYALDAAKGTLLWSRDLPDDQIIAQPVALDDQRAYIVACGSPTSVARDVCSINAYTADKGSTIWRTAEPRHRLEQLTIWNNKIYAISESNLNTYIAGTGVYAWNSTDGKQLWHYENPKDLIMGSSSPLLVADNQVYIGQVGGDDQKQRYMYKRLALDAATGTIRWQFPKSSEFGELRTISDHTLFAGSGDTLFAYKTTDGSKLWQYTFAPISSGNNDTISITDIVVIPPLV
jgi:outer membrane protein assembly factor BamB